MDVDADSESCTCGTAEELLLKTIGESRYVLIEDVTKILASDVFVNDMMATCKGKTLLHMAAMARDVSVLTTVVQAYKKAGLLVRALSTATQNEDGSTPLHVAVHSSSYENTVLLLKECQEHCPDILTATRNGATLLHLAASWSEGVTIVKYLLREHKDICTPMLVVKHRGDIPLDYAQSIKLRAEWSLANAKSFAERAFRGSRSVHHSGMKNVHTEHQRRELEQAKELFNVLYEPTMEARAAEAERQAKLREEEKFREKELKINEGLESLLKSEKWDALINDYIQSSDEDIQRIALNFLATSLSDSDVSPALPPLTEGLLQLMKKYLKGPGEDLVLKSVLKLLAEFSVDSNSCKVLLDDSEEVSVLSLVLKLMRHLQTSIQYLCVTTLLHLAMNCENSSCPEEWKQPLLLVKNFSVDSEVKRVASEVMDQLGTGTEVPDPGAWDVADVSFWMEGNLSIEKRSEFVRAFRDAEIDGLHLLELSPTEMTGLGIKFVSDQRNLSALIDDLRRLNMRSVIGKKDVFLSYAHINIQFALQIKRVLNERNYTVWIDTAGIRAGQKWKTEIAHGIHDCRLFLFVMTPRSTNSQYCHDELSLAEEYKKPIVTIQYQHTEEMDPGLKLTIQRRQWTDFTDSAQFSDSCTKLLDAIHTLIGDGSGPESEECEQSQTVECAAEDTTGGTHVGPGTPSAISVQELVAKEVEKIRVELMGTVHSLEAKVSELSTRIAMLESRER